MDWLLTTPQLYSAFSSLRELEGDTYVINPNALAILEEINHKLTYEDQTLRTFRRAIGFGQNVRCDLIPLLENAKDEEILDSVIRILVNLTVPVECLFSVDVMYRTEVGRHTMFELNKLLYTSKEAFTDPKSTKSVVEYMKHILESESKLSPKKCDQINNCLLLLRNVLHIPESCGNYLMPTAAHNPTDGTVSMHNGILWNLFIQSIDKLLLYLMTCPQRAFWGVTLVQLIALIYKDQHVSTLQKLLNLWFDASLSESSEDNESNTSPPKQSSYDSSPLLTSDPTSDSSDNGSQNAQENEARRPSFRDDTEATLLEVSRKGHEYQNAMLRDARPDNDNTTSDNADKRNKEEEESENNETTTIKENHKTNKTNKQPAESISCTTNSLADEINAKEFMPPPALPHKPISSVQASILRATTAAPMQSIYDPELLIQTTKPCQKTSHSGNMKLKMGPQKRECASSQSEQSDCGYGTQVENHESISTSSNEDDAPQSKPQHQKPPYNTKPRNKPKNILMVIDKKDLRRKKLVKRSKSNLINMKGLVQHTPTDEDVANMLKEFTVDFLLKGYNYMVEDFYSLLLTNNLKITIDTSHFFWLVTYFLKFAVQLELDLEHINAILSYDVISYLTYAGVELCEQLELNSRQKGSDLKPYLQRMHLAVTAIREFLQAIECYKKVTHLSEEDRERIKLLQLQIAETEDLRNLFVLLLRRFNPSLHTKLYLQDLVVTNHMLLLILDNVTTTNPNTNIKMIDHVSQFANLEVMHYYGILLEDFESNGEYINDCIFTMMHHVGGDLGQIGKLFQPLILKTYSRIWEADYELCNDWSDLIEYVIHTFMNTPQTSPLALPSTSLTELTKEHNMETSVCTWTQVEMDTLYWYYVQSKKNNDVVGTIVKLFGKNGNKKKSRISIIQQLLQQDIITLVEFDDLMKFEDAEYQRTLLATPTSGTSESGIDLQDSSSYSKPSEDIQVLLDLIIKDKKDQNLVWLQKLLLECCYIKLTLKQSPQRELHQNLKYVMEPVAYHFILKNKSVPVVQWNNDQATTMLYQPFVLLLHKLGIQLPADAGSVFARIPDFWTPEMMFSLAKKLGPLDKLLIKFDESLLEDFFDSDMSSSFRSASGPRNSFSSLGSFEYEHTDMEDLATIPEMNETTEKSMPQSSELFAVPNTKQSNSIIRFTPEPLAKPSIPKWLQLVIQTKCNSTNTNTNNNNTNTDNTDKTNIVASSTASAAASNLANLAFGECNEQDICMSNNNAPNDKGNDATVRKSSISNIANNVLMMTATTATETLTGIKRNDANENHVANNTTSANNIDSAAVSAAIASANAMIATMNQPTTPLPCPSINNIIGIQHETCNKAQKFNTAAAAAHKHNSNLNDNNDAKNNNNDIDDNADDDDNDDNLNNNATNNDDKEQHRPEKTCKTSQNSTCAATFLKPALLLKALPSNLPLLPTSVAAAVSFEECCKTQRNVDINGDDDDDDSTMKSLEHSYSDAAAIAAVANANLKEKFNAIIATVYEQENDDCDSVASDLTRMYVSDEDDKHEYPLAHTLSLIH